MVLVKSVCLLDAFISPSNPPHIDTMAKSKNAFKSGSGVWLWLGLALITLLLDQLTKIAIVGSFQLGETLPLTSFFT